MKENVDLKRLGDETSVSGSQSHATHHTPYNTSHTLLQEATYQMRVSFRAQLGDLLVVHAGKKLDKNGHLSGILQGEDEGGGGEGGGVTMVEEAVARMPSTMAGCSMKRGTSKGN